MLSSDQTFRQRLLLPDSRPLPALHLVSWLPAVSRHTMEDVVTRPSVFGFAFVHYSAEILQMSAFTQFKRVRGTQNGAGPKLKFGFSARAF